MVGYDDTYLARIRHLSLTSVDNGSFAVGTQAAKFLLERLAHPERPLPARTQLVGTELRIRTSSGTAPSQ